MIYPKRSKTDFIIIHCTATTEGKDLHAKDIDRLHRARGLNGIGFHYVVTLDGSVESGRPQGTVGAHVQGLNSTSIGIAYVGGLDTLLDPKDTRTPRQKQALEGLVTILRGMYPDVQVLGHRDVPQELVRGRADPFTVLRESPCFDAALEYAVT